MKDPEIKRHALELFIKEAPKKFEVGMMEHNPKGDKGMWRMTTEQLVDSAIEETIDQFHYLYVLKEKLRRERELKELKERQK
tara:strand:- start:93 stop:338 length:246 start_codon:yes stop_codon:yes gene_type:complete